MFLELYAQIVYELFWYFLTKIIIYFLMQTIEKPSSSFFSKICKSLVLTEFTFNFTQLHILSCTIERKISNLKGCSIFILVIKYRADE